MIIRLNKTIDHKTTAIWGAIFCLPFAFAFTTAITGFKPFLSLISYNGRATTFGLVIFYVGLIGLPLAFLVNLLSILTVNVSVRKWRIERKIAFHPSLVNFIIGVVSLLVIVVFGGHLLIDTLACLSGNIAACD